MKAPRILVSLSVLAALGAAACSSGEATPAREGCVGETAAPLQLCAKGPVLEGIDVSVWQGDVDWAKVKGSGRAFAFARVANGLLKPDTKFAANWPAMKAAGLVRGAYLYFRPSQDAAAQAKAVLDALEAAGGLEAGDLPPVLDLEATDDLPAATVQAAAKTWLDIVEAKIGKKPIVYTAAYMSPQIGTSFGPYPLWVAHYTQQCPEMPAGWATWQFWQRSDKGTVPGIAGPVDLDSFDGTLADLQKLTLTCAPGACDPPADAGAPANTPPQAEPVAAPQRPANSAPDPCASR